MSKRDRDRKKAAKARKQRTEDNQLGRIEINELGNGRDQSHLNRRGNEEGRIEPVLPNRESSEV